LMTAVVAAVLGFQSLTLTSARELQTGAINFSYADVQRLVRLLCPECKVEVTPRPLAKRLLALSDGQKVWEAKGCAACFGTGYRGRTGVFEIFTVTEKVQEAIIRGEDEKELTRIGIDEGMVLLDTSARNKIFAGLTSFDEVSRVVVLQED